LASVKVEVGDNYCVELDGNFATCRVWSRPDLDFQTGARLAAQKVAICRALAARLEARGMLFDLRDAPKVTGPKTQESLSLILEAWEAAARPIAIVVTPASMQKLQLTRLAGAAAPRHAEVFVDVDEARAWIEQRIRARRQPHTHSRVAPPAPALQASERAGRGPVVSNGSLRARSLPPAKRRP
jgi:hypothetical protein